MLLNPTMALTVSIIKELKWNRELIFLKQALKL